MDRTVVKKEIITYSLDSNEIKKAIVEYINEHKTNDNYKGFASNDDIMQVYYNDSPIRDIQYIEIIASYDLDPETEITES